MKIQHKLFLFLFGFSLLLVSILIVIVQWSIDKGMVEYVNTKEVEALQPVVAVLAQEYEKKESWQFIQSRHKKFYRLVASTLMGSEFSTERNQSESHRKRIGDDRRTNSTKHESSTKYDSSKKHEKYKKYEKYKKLRRAHMKNSAHYAVLDPQDTPIVGRLLKRVDYSKTAIEVDGKVVGYFAVSKRNRLTKGYELDFIEQQQSYLWLIALIVMCLVGVVTLPLARHLVEPLKQITQGMNKLAHGDYEQSLDIKRKDELGQLCRDYNELAMTLAENETARKRWLANISHELRTPVAILRGELEAMLDEVRPLTLANVASANDEVRHLQRLIDDLNLLTSTDIGAMNYRKQHEDLVELIEGEEDKYRSYLSDADIELQVTYSKGPMDIYGDKTRLYQLFENIINNSVKYSSATMFKITMAPQPEDRSHVQITFEDNGRGVDEKHLPHLFEHLYRVEDSRNRKTGGSGLGLSICRHIVQAHKGTIIAKRSALGGLAIIINLPLS